MTPKQKKEDEVRPIEKLKQIPKKEKDFDPKDIKNVDGDLVYNKDGVRITILPDIIIPDLKEHLVRVKSLHELFLKKGYGSVELPYVLARKYPNAQHEWKWQYVFPAKNVSIDPRSGVKRRHHIHDSVMQRAVKKAINLAGITKHVSCHTFIHLLVTNRMLEMQA